MGRKGLILRAIEMRATGERWSTIADVLGIPKSTLGDWVRSEGIPPASRVVRLPASVVAEYEDGASIETLARTYECSVAVVRRHLQRAGIALRSTVEAVALYHGHATALGDLPAEQIVADYEGGASLRALGIRYGAPHTSIRRLLLARGVPLRGMSEAARQRGRQPEGR